MAIGGFANTGVVVLSGFVMTSMSFRICCDVLLFRRGYVVLVVFPIAICGDSEMLVTPSVLPGVGASVIWSGGVASGLKVVLSRSTTVSTGELSAPIASRVVAPRSETWSDSV